MKREHKLKHWGRLQYGLFLKGAGLDLEGAQQFWESHFSKVMNHDQFVKNYSYSFRHMYGKEGARKNYTPYSCMKIIMGTPPEAGSHHGCPYRYLVLWPISMVMRVQLVMMVTQHTQTLERRVSGCHADFPETQQRGLLRNQVPGEEQPVPAGLSETLRRHPSGAHHRECLLSVHVFTATVVPCAIMHSSHTHLYYRPSL